MLNITVRIGPREADNGCDGKGLIIEGFGG